MIRCQLRSETICHQLTDSALLHLWIVDIFTLIFLRCTSWKARPSLFSYAFLSWKLLLLSARKKSCLWDNELCLNVKKRILVSKTTRKRKKPIWQHCPFNFRRLALFETSSVKYLCCYGGALLIISVTFSLWFSCYFVDVLTVGKTNPLAFNIINMNMLKYRRWQ